jgi:hypothetical protein
MFSRDDLSIDLELDFQLSKRGKAKIIQYFKDLGPGSIELGREDGEGTVGVRHEQAIVQQVEAYVRKQLHLEQERAYRRILRSALTMLEDRMRALDGLYREDT